jgi:hypothetical protein
MKLSRPWRSWLGVGLIGMSLFLYGFRAPVAPLADGPSRARLADCIGQTLLVLEPFLRDAPSQKIPPAAGWIDLSDRISRSMRLGLATGLLAGFPDSTFRPGEKVRIVELLHVWSGFVHYLARLVKHHSVVHSPALATNIPLVHAWFHDDLAVLAGIGALNVASWSHTLEHFATEPDMKELMRATIQYFTRDHALAVREGDQLKLWFKEAGKRIPREGWQVRFSPIGEWIPLSNDIRVEIASAVVLSGLELSHPDYQCVAGGGAGSGHDGGFRLFEVKEARRGPRLVEKAVAVVSPPSEGGAAEAEESPDAQSAEIVAVSAAPVASAPPTVLRGVVLDALTKAPLRRASVLVEGVSLLTDQDGQFQISLATRNGTADVFVTAEGYQSLSCKQRTDAARRLMKVFLKPYRSHSRLTIISAADGKPISGAVIEWDGKKSTTDRQGSVNIRGVKPGYHQVRLTADSFVAASELVYVEEKPTARTIRLQPRLAALAETLD